MKQKSLAAIEEQIERSHLYSTTGENAPPRQVRNVGRLKESGVKWKVARRRGGAFPPPSRSRGGDMSYLTEVVDA